VEITRDEFEDWLDSHSRGHWKRDPRYAGVYLISITDKVGIKVSSTIKGSTSTGMGKGEASGNMALVSLFTGQTLNAKDKGQNYFARTLNWRVNWLKGLNNLKAAYQKYPRFYDVKALYLNLDDYKKEILEKITSVPGWQDVEILQSLHTQVANGRILSEKQTDIITKATQAKPVSKNVKEEITRKTQVIDFGDGKLDRRYEFFNADPEKLLEALRRAWVMAKARGWQEEMDFLKRVGLDVKKNKRIDREDWDEFEQLSASLGVKL